MARIHFTHYGDLVRYDRSASALLIFDAQQAAFLSIRSADSEVEPLRTLAAIEPLAHAFALAYTLVLQAREWRDRPTDARRGALIQMAERLKQSAVSPAAPALLDATVQAADAAFVRGDDAEETIIRFVTERVRLADRAADRCGRHAINLIDSGDRVQTYGFAGPPFMALLGALPTFEQPVTLLVAGEQAGAALLASTVEAAGYQTQFSSDADASLCIISAWALARDGSLVCASGTGPLVERMRQMNTPCYVLAPSGPHASAETAAQLVPAIGPIDIMQPDLVSAIVTDRGMYRPAMIERYLGESDAPPDVIPLGRKEE